MYSELSRSVTRREFLKYSAVMSASAAAAGIFPACAVDPVTGEKELVMVSRQQEIEIDRQHAAFQFSSDYGITLDSRLNRYVSRVGEKLLPYVHRPDMPYRFACVNATYINAYAFPGGTIAVTRGILLKLDNEAELAALIGHELGHVNARHTAEQISKSQLSSLLLTGLAMAADSRGSGLGEVTQQLGLMGQGLLLSKYSRDNEREADALGNAYMVKAGYPSKGFVGLMEMLDSLHRKKPGAAEILFSTHPMSDERLNSAVDRWKGQYSHTKGDRLNRERYMDKTAALRAKREGVELLQKGEAFLSKKSYSKARQFFRKALAVMETDYTAHVLMAKCLLVMDKPLQAAAHADEARQIYPSEFQGHYIAGVAAVRLERFDRAYQHFQKGDALLPGIPRTTFYKGYTRDKAGMREPAARHYIRYLKMLDDRTGPYAKHALSRLKKWGYAE